MSDDFKTVINSIGDLPPMPVVAIKVLQLLQDPNVSTASLADTISNDPAVSARVLKIANSAFYSMRRQVKTLEHALVVVGEKTLRSLVLAASLEVMNKQVGLVEKMLWEDSLGCAIGARVVARKFKTIDPEEAFLGGLFRHLGLIVMNHSDRDRFSIMMQASYSGEGPLDTLEEIYFPYKHAIAGAAVLNKWNFSDALVQCALHHEDMILNREENSDLFNLTATVNIADALCMKLGIGQRDPMEDLDLMSVLGVQKLSLAEDELVEVEEQVATVFEENREFFFG